MTSASGQFSFAIGRNSTASGMASIVMGESAAASDDNSIAIGYNCTASNPKAIAIGDGASAQGPRSLALGTAPAARGLQSVALGTITDANGENSIAIGYEVTADSANTFVIGNTSEIFDELVNDVPHSLMVGFNDTTATLFVGGPDNRIGVRTHIPTAKLDVEGDTGYDQVRMRTSYTPTGTADANGNVGDIAWDDSYVYIKTNAGWKRSTLVTF
jgi:autotransporter adhesin